ncbi:DUF373 family protein [Candidatus Bathyarchaeota archaeon]|nr:DUF373 family protein [Candidatus Bathyarchaeota archaeon]
MAKEEAEGKEQKRILILCVDRDGDLGAKANIKTPVIGREENLEAAVALALKDPEEPDANAMFEAVRTFDKLKGEAKSDEVFEIATISGSEFGGVGADREVVAELSSVLGSFSANETILVTDGYSDEAVIPLIQSRAPVISVRRIVVKHSESIEETAAIFARYLKLLIENPRYSRIALGLPGVLLLILGVLSIAGVSSMVYWYAFVFVLSIFLVVKGFGVDKTARNFYKWMKEYSPPPLRVQISTSSAIAGAICTVLGVYLGWTNAAAFVAATSTPGDLTGWFNIFPQLTGYFLKGSVILIVVGICAALIGRAIHWYLEHDSRLLRNAALIVSVIWSRQILDAASDLLIGPESVYEAARLNLIFFVVVGILIGVASVLVIFVIHRSYREFFGETEEQVEEFGQS